MLPADKYMHQQVTKKRHVWDAVIPPRKWVVFTKQDRIEAQG